MRRIVTALGLLFAIGPAARALGDRPDVTELRAVLDNETLPVEERSRRVLDGATQLDQAAQASPQTSARRALWVEATKLLDEFAQKHPESEAAPLIRFQAAVYRWAVGRSFVDQAEFAPTDPNLRKEAVRGLDDSIGRFRSIIVKPGEANDPFAQNVRFRLAQAIADRASLDPEDDPARVALEREALASLDGSLTTPGLRPFARLLRAELSNRLGLFGQAQMEVEAAEKLNPPPPAEPLLEAKVGALIGRSRNDEAAKVIDSSKVGDASKRRLRLHLALVRRSEKAPGPEREAIDAEAFGIAERLRGDHGADARRALMELARRVDEPGPSAPSEWWDLLADGHLRLGDPTRAGRLESRGADRAEAQGRPELAAALRYKAGAALFAADHFAEADLQFGLVVGSSVAARDLKARAGMLQGLARGRALATGEVGSSRKKYLEALEAQVRDFPGEIATGEARWLLGQARLAERRPVDASDLWAGIQHGHPRWLEARTRIADRHCREVESQRINRDTSAVASKMEAARKSLRNALDDARDGPEGAALTLLLARLELTPEAGRPSLALDACDRALRLAASPEQHQLARLYRVVALAQSNRAVEAEKLARAEARVEDLAGLLPVIRLLNRSASDTEVESSRRRFGLIARIFTARLVDRLDLLPEAMRDEARLDHVRALLFSGDPVAARREIADWGGPTGEVDDDLLRELADTYQRIDAYDLAIEAERLRSRRLIPGSLPWFESRYGMALAYFRSDRPEEARKLIDASAILHPDLGGGELKIRFERLRQKIGQE